MKPVALSRLCLLFAGGLLTACAGSRPVILHELARYPSAGVASAERARYALRVGPVSLPQSVDQPRIVLRVAPGTFSASERQRWSGDLRDDLAQAITEQLAQRLPDAYVFNAGRQPANRQSPRFQLALDVQRFESSLRDAPLGAVLDVAWRLQEPTAHRDQSCRLTISRPPVGAGLDGVIEAHRQAIAGLSEVLADQLRSAAAGQWQLPAGASCQPAGLEASR